MLRQPLQHGPVSDEAAGRADVDGLINAASATSAVRKGTANALVGRDVASASLTSVIPRPPCISRRWTTAPSEPPSKQSATTATSTATAALLSHWRANIDFQIILDWDQAVRYMVKYVSKREKRSTATAHVFARAISRVDDDTDEA